MTFPVKPSTPVWQSGHALAANCLAFWPFHNATDVDPTDLSGNSRTALRRTAGQLPTWHDGDLGRDMLFNFTYYGDAYVASGMSNLALATKVFSYAILFHSTNKATTDVWLSEANSGGSSDFAYLGTTATSGYSRAAARDGAATKTATLVSTVDVCDGNWHLLALTCDGTNIKLHTDSTTPVSDTIAGTYAPNDFTLGSFWRSSVSNNATGTLCMAGVWSVDIGTAGVASLYADPWGVVRPAVRLKQNTYRQLRA